MVLIGMMTFISAGTMRKINSLFVLPAIAILAGCSNDYIDAVFPEHHEEKTVTEISAVLCGESPITKLTFQEGMDASGHTILQSKWSESDAIVITPDAKDASRSVAFNLVGGQGTERGIFKGEKDLTDVSRTWTVYYPASVKSDSDFNAFSFSNQIQEGDDNTAHLSALNLMRKEYTFTSEQTAPLTISFSGDGFEQSSCIKFVLSGFPDSIVPESLKFEVYNYAIWMWSQLSKEVREEVYFSQTMSFSDIQATDSLTAYMMIPPTKQIFSVGQSIRLTIEGSDGKKFVTERRIPEDMVLEKGTYNTMSIKKNWIYDTGIDGTWGTFQSPTADVSKEYCNIIFMGDGYTYEDYQGGEDCKFMKDSRAAYEAIFSIEPYRSLKDYFGVYYVNVVSGQKIHTKGKYLNGAENADSHTPFEVTFTPNATKTKGYEIRALYYAGKIGVLSESQVCRSVMCVIANAYCHAGSCTLYYGNYESDYCENYSIAYLSLGNEGTNQPENFRLCVMHEVGGHGFGKLADEYTMPEYYPNRANAWNNLSLMQDRGIYHNVSKYEEGVTTINDTPWASLANVSIYEPEHIGVYDGAYAVSWDFCRSTPNSIMCDSTPTNNADYFNAISRKQIYHRVMRLSGKSQQEAENGFLAWDESNMPQSGPYAQTESMLMSASGPDNGLMPLAEPTVICLEE